jgi:uncharacterized protein (TIGR04255 family)
MAFRRTLQFLFMPFPDSPRVVYTRNPLKEVICQLNFPAILRIDTELPTNFQEGLRALYPIFKEEQAATLRINLPSSQPQVPAEQLGLRANRTVYRFLSEDSFWTVTLARDSLSMSAKSYRTWEDFSEHFKVPFEMLLSEYKPSFFTRIGLRYLNVIDRKELGLEGEPWSELLKPHIAGELSSAEIADRIQSAVSQLSVLLDDEGGLVLINHGLVGNEISNQGDDLSYLIDNDFSIGRKTEVNDALAKLNYFNRFSGRLFQWCITTKLHDALLPEPL